MNALFLFLTEKPLERMGINLGTTPFCHSETDQVAFAEAETETSFHLEGAGERLHHYRCGMSMVVSVL